MTAIHILIDDRPSPVGDNTRGLIPEHGFSLYFEHLGKKWLLDTGATSQFIKNANTLGIDLSEADHLVLSHVHYDHTGGLKSFFEINGRATVYLSRTVKGNAYYSFKNGEKRFIGMDENLLNEYSGRFRLLDDNNFWINEQVGILCHIPTPYPCPKGNRILSSEKEGTAVADDFSHEIAMVMKTSAGLAIFSSCTHKGLLNTLAAACDFAGSSNVMAFIGGTHLIDGPYETYEELAETAALLQEHYPIMHLYTGHCTGENALKTLSLLLPGKITAFYTGASLELPV